MTNQLSRLAQQGHGPPQDVPPGTLLLRLMDSRRPSEVVDFPRHDDEGKPLFQYRIQILTADELDLARANAEQYTRRLIAARTGAAEAEVANVRREAWSEIYEDAKCVELLFAACREPDDITKPLFQAPAQMRKLLTTDELTAMFRAYEAVQYRWGPTWRELSDEEVDEWVEKLTVGIGAYPLLGLGPGELTQLLASLASRLRALKTATGSSGLLPSSGQSETSLTSTDD